MNFTEALKMHRIAALIVLVCIGHTYANITTIGIVHYNDLFGQLERFKSGVTPLVPCGEAEAKCSGGIAELMAHIREIRNNDFLGVDTFLTFSAGNMISGENGWIRLLNETYSPNGWTKYGEILGSDYGIYVNYGRPNATALGPREFDGGLKLLNDYIKGMKTEKAVVSNVDCSASPDGDENEFCSESMENFQVIDTGKVKIGIVGYVDTFVVHQSEPGSLQFQDTVTSLKDTVRSLLASNSDVKIIFAIGTGPLTVAQSIIDEIPEIKLVVYGGGKNSDMSDSEYPLKYNTGYIATAFKYGESLGKLLLHIDDTNGDIVTVGGSSRIKNDFTNRVDIDDFMRLRVERLKDFVESDSLSNGKGKEVLGKSKIDLQASVSTCWGKECPMGDLITDSMVHCALNNKDIDAPVEVISLWHSSGISGQLPRDSSITRLDVHKWMAYNNMATLVTMKGDILKRMFNASAQSLADPSSVPKWGQFLQVSSGVEVHYVYDDRSNQVESTVKIAELNTEGRFVFQEVDESKLYWVVIPSFMYNGRNVYHFLPANFESINAEKYDIDMDYKCLENYIKALGTVSLGYQERMYFSGKLWPTTTSTESPTTSESRTTASTDGDHKTSPTPHTDIPPPTTESVWGSMDSFSKAEVVLTSVGITLLIVVVAIAAIFAFLIKTNRRPTIIRHKRMYNDDLSFNSSKT